MSKDLNGLSDPFVEVSIGDELLFTSQTVEKSLNPQWNEQCTVRLPHATSTSTSPSKRRHRGAHRPLDSSASGEELLELTVYDRDLVGRNEFMGALAFSRAELRALSADDRVPAQWFDLRSVKRGRLRLRFYVLFDPFPDAPAASASASPALTSSTTAFLANNADVADEAESASGERRAPRPQTLAIVSQTSASASSTSSTRDTLVLQHDQSRASFQLDTQSFVVASPRLEQKTFSPPSHPSAYERSDSSAASHSTSIRDSLFFSATECTFLFALFELSMRTTFLLE